MCNQMHLGAFIVGSLSMSHSTRISARFRSCSRSLYRWKDPLIVVLLPLLLLPLPLVVESKFVWKAFLAKTKSCLAPVTPISSLVIFYDILGEYEEEINCGLQEMVSKGAYVVILMGTFWVLEVMPIAVTSLIPIFLFPLLGIMSAREVCFNYAEDTVMLFLGSLIVAVAVEKCNLHRRIALRALTLVGPEPRWLLFGIMFPCWFLSMWMSNTATAAMMLPILNAILKQIRDVTLPDIEEAHHSGEDGNDDDNEMEIATALSGMSMERLPLKSKAHNQTETTEHTPKTRADKERDFHELTKIFALSISYAANAGGVATLTGTPPNIILKGHVDKLYRRYDLDPGLTFANWLIFGLPTSFCVFLMTWLWLQLWYLRKRFLCCIKDNRSWDAVKKHLRMEYTSLGSMTFAEVVVAVCFILLAVLWITRDPQFIDGWGVLFPKGFVKDSTPAIFISVIMFVLPAYPPRCFRCRAQNDREPKFPVATTETKLLPQKGFTPLLTWKIVNEEIAWDVVLLMGGGFAMSDGCTKSGLSDWIGTKLEVLGTLSPWVISFILALVVAAVTNITSNSATATIFLPIAADLALRLQINPMYLMIPVAVSASFAYLLPVGTPPNAIVFSSGYLQTRDMLKIGIVVNVLAVLILVFMSCTLAVAAYGLDGFPLAFRGQTNTTLNMTTLVPIISLSNSSI